MKSQTTFRFLFLSLCLAMVMGLTVYGYADPCFDRRSRGSRCERPPQPKSRPSTQREGKPASQRTDLLPSRNQQPKRRANSIQIYFNGR